MKTIVALFLLVSTACFAQLTPLMKAAEGDLAEVRRLLAAGANVNEQARINSENIHYEGQTALFFAVECPDAFLQSEIMNALISAGADLEIRDSNQETAIMWASRYSRVLDQALNILVDHGANVNFQNEYGDSPLLTSIRWGFFDRTHKLLEAKANPNLVNQDGESPLVLMLKKRYYVDENRTKANLNIIEKLLELGVDTTHLRDENGLTPSMLVSFYGMYGSTHAEEYARKILDLFIQYNADFETQFKTVPHSENESYYSKYDGLPVLSMRLRMSIGASVEDSYFALKLIEFKKGTEALDVKGNTPLLVLSQIKPQNETEKNSQLTFCTKLIAGGVNLNAQNYQGQTALIIAAISGNDLLVGTLLKAKANVNLKDKQGMTALMWAKKNGFVNIVNLLELAGAEVSK